MRPPCGRQAARRLPIAAPTGMRCKAEARLSLTLGLGSFLASSANRLTASAAGALPSQSSRIAQARMCSLGSASSSCNRFLAEAARGVKRPERTQAAADFRIGRQHLLERAIRLAQVFPGGRAFLKQPPGGAHVPVIGMELIARQGEVAFARKIDLHRTGAVP